MTSPPLPTSDEVLTVLSLPPYPDTAAVPSSAERLAEAREQRRQAETIYATIIQDLRFADAKAGFVVVLAGSWSGAVNAVVPLMSTAYPTRVRVACGLFGLSTLLAIGFGTWAIIPKNPITGGDLHHVRRLAKHRPLMGNPAGLVDRLRAVLGDHAGQAYDESLLVDIVRVADRCDEKYVWVKAAAVATLVAMAIGAALIAENAAR